MLSATPWPVYATTDAEFPAATRSGMIGDAMPTALPRLAALVLTAALWGTPRADEDPAQFLSFVEEPAAGCVARSGMQILVRNTHPTRTLRVWLDRYLMGVGTGDRSRSDLAPGAEPEALGCSRSSSGVQEWRLVRVIFVDKKD